MTITELKKKVILKIYTMEDKSLLKEVSKIIGVDNQESEVYQLSVEQLKAVKEAEQQYLRGEYITNEELEKEIEEWLNA